MMFHTKRLVKLVECALSDSGASSHFLVEGSAACTLRRTRPWMWKLSINPMSQNNMIEGLDLRIPRQQRQGTTRIHAANNIYTLPYKHHQLKYMHESFFSPPSQTIVEAVNSNQLQGMPCLHSPKQVNKYLAPSPATSKGRLKSNEPI